MPSLISNDPTQPVTPDHSSETRPVSSKTQPVKSQSGDQVDALFNKTIPVKANTTSEPPEIPGKSRRFPWLKWIVASLVLIVLAAGLSGYIGYRNAIHERVVRKSNQVILQAGEQYNLALADMKAGQWDRAKTRLEYVIQLDPSFPEAANQLKNVLVAQIGTATPTTAPTATDTPIPGTPTPDLRSAQDYITQIQAYLSSKDWDKAISTIEQLRQLNRNFQTVQVDGLLYVALRNRGVDEILQKGELEQGTYDLGLAEAIGPLDAQANNYRTWAAEYLNAASYWGVNWQRVVDGFSQIYPSLPMLRDINGVTAQERFRIASIKLGDQLAAAGNYCKAQDQYNAALALGNDASVQATAQANQTKCNNAQNAAVTPTLMPTLVMTPTLEVTTVVPVATTAVAPQATPTIAPTTAPTVAPTEAPTATVPLPATPTPTKPAQPTKAQSDAKTATATP